MLLNYTRPNVAGRLTVVLAGFGMMSVVTHQVVNGQTASAQIDLSSGQVFITADGPQILGLRSAAGNITGVDADGNPPAGFGGGIEDVNAAPGEIGWFNLGGYNLNNVLAGALVAPGTPEDDLTFLFQNTGMPLMEGTITFITSPGVDGDYNGDLVVDAADYTVWRDTLGQTGADLAADGDGNMVVNQLDYDYWKARFGNSSGAGTASISARPIPEPSSVTAMLVATCLWASCVCRWQCRKA